MWVSPPEGSGEGRSNTPLNLVVWTELGAKGEKREPPLLGGLHALRQTPSLLGTRGPSAKWAGELGGLKPTGQPFAKRWRIVPENKPRATDPALFTLGQFNGPH